VEPSWYITDGGMRCPGEITEPVKARIKGGKLETTEWESCRRDHQEVPKLKDAGLCGGGGRLKAERKKKKSVRKRPKPRIFGGGVWGKMWARRRLSNDLKEKGLMTGKKSV